MNTVWKDLRFRQGWKSFESVIRRKLEAMRYASPEKQDADWDRIIRETLAFLERHKASGYTWDCFETFKSVIVRVTLPHGESRLPRIMLDERTLTLTGVPGKLDETIRLPAPIVPRRPHAVYADGVVEVRLRKKLRTYPARKVSCSEIRKPPAFM